MVSMAIGFQTDALGLVELSTGIEYGCTFNLNLFDRKGRWRFLPTFVGKQLLEKGLHKWGCGTRAKGSKYL